MTIAYMAPEVNTSSPEPAAQGATRAAPRGARTILTLYLPFSMSPVGLCSDATWPSTLPPLSLYPLLLPAAGSAAAARGEFVSVGAEESRLGPKRIQVQRRAESPKLRANPLTFPLPSLYHSTATSAYRPTPLSLASRARALKKAHDCWLFWPLRQRDSRSRSAPVEASGGLLVPDF